MSLSDTVAEIHNHLSTKVSLPTCHLRIVFLLVTPKLHAAGFVLPMKMLRLTDEITLICKRSHESKPKCSGDTDDLGAAFSPWHGMFFPVNLRNVTIRWKMYA
jgi:hypothetical protein